jgi:hypothetical protein
VIGIEGVSQPQHVGGKAQSDQRRVRQPIVKQQSAPT